MTYLKKISQFLTLYLSINIIFFILAEILSLRFMHSPLFILVHVLVFVGLINIIRKGYLDKYSWIFRILPFYVFAAPIFLISVFGAVEIIYQILLISYIITSALIVWKKKVKKLFWIPLLIIALQVGISFFGIIPSKRCYSGIKGVISYSCDCKGLKRSSFASHECAGERTACYKYVDGENRQNGRLEQIKQEVDCSYIDNFKQY